MERGGRGSPFQKIEVSLCITQLLTSLTHFPLFVLKAINYLFRYDSVIRSLIPMDKSSLRMTSYSFNYMHNSTENNFGNDLIHNIQGLIDMKLLIDSCLSIRDQSDEKIIILFNESPIHKTLIQETSVIRPKVKPVMLVEFRMETIRPRGLPRFHTKHIISTSIQIAGAVISWFSIILTLGQDKRTNYPYLDPYQPQKDY